MKNFVGKLSKPQLSRQVPLGRKAKTLARMTAQRIVLHEIKAKRVRKDMFSSGSDLKASRTHGEKPGYGITREDAALRERSILRR